MLQLMFFIMLWLSMGETAYVKVRGENWKQRIVLYLFAPFIHFAILVTKGTSGYFSNDWEYLD